ncbi:hypothetical protein MASR1M107_01780 [Ignavibacteriales bacterium]
MKKIIFYTMILSTIIFPYPKEQVKHTTQWGIISVDRKNSEREEESLNRQFDDLQCWSVYNKVNIRRDPSVEKYIFTINPSGVFGDSTPVRDVSLQSTDTSVISHIFKDYINIDTGNLPLEDIEPAKGKSKFGYKLLKGDKFTYKITSIMDISLYEKNELVNNTKMHLSFFHLVDFEVKNVDVASIAEVKVTIRSVDIKSEIDGIIIEYKTGDKPDSAKEVDYWFEMALTTNPFFVRIDKNGGIREILGIERIVNARINKMDGEIDADQIDIDTQRIKNRLEGIIRQVFVTFSPGFLNSNEIFKDKRPTKNHFGGFESNTTLLYTLRKKGRYKGHNISVIEVGSDVTIELNPQLKEKGLKVERKMFTVDGRIFYNDELGKLQKSKTSGNTEIVISGRIHNRKGGVIDHTYIQKEYSLTVSEIIQ